ncbi:MAG: NUDIX hydrolase [Minisyncoccota bacterium]
MMWNTIRSGFGLPGGKVGVINGVSITVKCLIFSENGLLIVKEKSPQLKSQEERKKEALSLKEIRHRIWKLISRRRERGDLSIDEGLLRKLFENAKEDEESIISLSAVREILEETGLLIEPQQLTRILIKNSGLPHVVVVCFGEIISGKFRKESNETFNSFKKLSDLPPTDGEVEAEKIMKTELMFYRHKAWYIPSGLKILLEKNFDFPFSKEEVEDFIKNIAPLS